LIGIDARPKEGALGRTDTMILTTFQPLRPYVGALSIPRDLWVKVPGYGENRINTAHFFAEAAKPGSGPAAAMDVVKQNFGVNVDYFVRVQFSGFKDIVDALGGVDVTLPTAMSGYEAGTYHLNGTEALALVRDRETSDDFFRMGRGQLFIKAVIKEVMKPTSWVHLPEVLAATAQAVDTNVPVWQWPRLAFAILRVGPSGIDARIISRDMVTPFITSGGADVLSPKWGAINPVLMEMFGQ
ncbi:MAG TPA: LCP family protein, partial [Anaerolineales bacterium]